MPKRDSDSADDIDDVLDLNDPENPPADLAPTNVRGLVQKHSKKPKPSVIETDEHGVRRFRGYVIPPSAQRIRIVDAKGQGKLRKITELDPGDTPVLSSDGLPIFIEGQVGAPNKTLNTILPPATPLQADLLRVKEGHLRTDSIIQTVEADPESIEVLNQVLLGLGEEQASMRFERMEAERRGGDTSALSMRRVQTLKALGDVFLKRKEQVLSKTVDLESPTFRVLFEFMCETFTKAMTSSGVREEQVDTVMNQFAKLLDDSWKNEAKNRMKK